MNYMSSAPLALAFERYLEGRILGQVPFRRPVLDLGCGDGLFAHLLFDSFTYNPQRICLLNDALYPLAGMSLLSKGLFDRWVLWPRLRRLTMRPLSRIVEGFLEGGLRADPGGLVFLALEKGASR